MYRNGGSEKIFVLRNADGFVFAVKVPKPKADGDALMAEDADPPLPQTLVRIPTEQP